MILTESRKHKLLTVSKIIIALSVIGSIGYGIYYYYVFMTPHCSGWGNGGYVCDSWASDKEKYGMCLGQSIIDVQTGKSSKMTPYDCNMEIYGDANHQ